LPKTITLTDSETVQAFIDEEHAETTYDDRYCGAYSNRHLELDNLDEMAQDHMHVDDPGEAIQHSYARLYGAELKSQMEGLAQRRKELELLQDLQAGQRSGQEFEFRGQRFRAGEAKKLRKKVERELEADRIWLKDLDRRVFRVHYRMARQLGPAVVNDLMERYRFHRVVQSILYDLAPYQFRLTMLLQDLADRSELDQGDFEQAFNLFREAHRTLERSLVSARPLRMPSLKNIAEGERLAGFLLPRSLVHELSDTERSLDGKWIARFMEQFTEVSDRAQRIHSKSLGAILALQEKIANDWQSLAVKLPPSGLVPTAAKQAGTPD
jgi:hypothetical protein